MLHREENAPLVKMKTEVSVRFANREPRAVRTFLDRKPARVRQLFTSVHADRYGFRCKGTRKILSFALSIRLCPERTRFRISRREARQYKNGHMTRSLLFRILRIFLSNDYIFPYTNG